MKTQQNSNSKSGFSLVELMVSMAITLIIVTVLVSITSMAMDTWNRSRSELRASRQAKAMVDAMTRDLEGLVIRSGNNFEWLSAIVDLSDDVGESSNASKLIFFTAATDRYNGEIGTDDDLGGDVSCVGYGMAWKDPIGATSDEKLKTFVLNRLLVDPKETFDTLLGQADIGSKFLPSTALGDRLSEQENFVCENVFQFTVTFHVQVKVTETDNTVTPPVTNVRTVTVPVTLGEDTTKFQILGTGNVTDYVDPDPELTALIPSGRITAVGIAVSVLSNSGITQLPVKLGKDGFEAWLAKNSYQYSKLIQLPGM